MDFECFNCNCIVKSSDRFEKTVSICTSYENDSKFENVTVIICSTKCLRDFLSEQRIYKQKEENSKRFAKSDFGGTY